MTGVQTMTNVLLALVLALLLLVAAQTSLLVHMQRSRPSTTEPEHTPPDRTEQEREDERGNRAIDEGFENIMTYQVNLGHGRTSGGEP